MKKNRSKGNGFIQRLAAEWIQEMGLVGFVGHPEVLFEMPGVLQRIRRLRPATLGILAAQGAAGGTGRRTCLYDVAQGAGVERYASGKEHLRCLARTAVAAEMFDQLGRPYGDEWRTKAERELDEEFDRGMRDYVHHGSNSSMRQ